MKQGRAQPTWRCSRGEQIAAGVCPARTLLPSHCFVVLMASTNAARWERIRADCRHSSGSNTARQEAGIAANIVNLWAVKSGFSVELCDLGRGFPSVGMLAATPMPARSAQPPPVQHSIIRALRTEGQTLARMAREERHTTCDVDATATSVQWGGVRHLSQTGEQGLTSQRVEGPCPSGAAPRLRQTVTSRGCGSAECPCYSFHESYRVGDLRPDRQGILVRM